MQALSYNMFLEIFAKAIPQILSHRSDTLARSEVTCNKQDEKSLNADSPAGVNEIDRRFQYNFLAFKFFYMCFRR